MSGPIDAFTSRESANQLVSELNNELRIARETIAAQSEVINSLMNSHAVPPLADLTEIVFPLYFAMRNNPNLLDGVVGPSLGSRIARVLDSTRDWLLQANHHASNKERP